MKILGFDFNVSRAVDVTKTQPQRTKIISKIVKTQLIRQKEDVKKWRDATQTAESEIRPDRTQLIKIYKDTVLDSHLSALMSTVINSCLSADYFLVNNEGEIDHEMTAKIEKRWFRKFITETINTEFWGHTVVQLGNIVDDNFTELKVVPRENIIPERHVMKRHVFNTEDVIDYTEPLFRNWLIELGERDNFGILHKASPLALWKKNVMIAWSQYAELFGMPIRLGKTDIVDPDKKKNMEDMLKNMGSASFGVFDTDDMLEFVEARNEDAFMVFKEFINLANEEMSKLILGQTLTSIDGSSRSQAEVHERVMNQFVGAVKWTVRDTVNSKLLPILRIHGIIPEGFVFVWDKSEKLTKKEQFDIVDGLLDHYAIDPQTINEMFGIEVEEREAPVPLEAMSNRSKASTIMNEIHNLYKGWNPDGHTHKHE